jgi:hypothetical protein
MSVEAIDADSYPSEKYTGNTWQPQISVLVTLPASFSWCNFNGHNLCTANWQQHEPSYCAAGYIHATLSAVSDRIKISKHRAGLPGPDTLLSRQVMLNCGEKRGGFGQGCSDGHSFDVLEYLHRYGLPDETCQSYSAQQQNCDPRALCKTCMMLKGDLESHCAHLDENRTTLYRVKEYGMVRGEQNIIAEIYAHGPVTCRISISDAFSFGYHGDVYNHYNHRGDHDRDHDVEIVGW